MVPSTKSPWNAHFGELFAFRSRESDVVWDLTSKCLPDEQNWRGTTIFCENWRVWWWSTNVYFTRLGRFDREANRKEERWIFEQSYACSCTLGQLFGDARTVDRSLRRWLQTAVISNQIWFHQLGPTSLNWRWFIRFHQRHTITPNLTIFFRVWCESMEAHQIPWNQVWLYAIRFDLAESNTIYWNVIRLDPRRSIADFGEPDPFLLIGSDSMESNHAMNSGLDSMQWYWFCRKVKRVEEDWSNLLTATHAYCETLWTAHRGMWQCTAWRFFWIPVDLGIHCQPASHGLHNLHCKTHKHPSGSARFRRGLSPCTSGLILMLVDFIIYALDVYTNLSSYRNTDPVTYLCKLVSQCPID